AQASRRPPGREDQRRTPPRRSRRSPSGPPAGANFRRLQCLQARRPTVPVDRGDQRTDGSRLGRKAMKITADTNVLVRAMTDDDVRQSRVARNVLARAEMVAATLPTLCELAWVLSRGYKIPTGEIVEGFRRLINAANVVVNRPAAEAGLAHLEAGGDFADGVTAFEGAA